MDNTKPLQEGVANGQHWPAEKLEFKYRFYTEEIISVSTATPTQKKIKELRGMEED
jgi:hypothetical protein